MSDDARSEDGSATVLGVAIIVGLVSLLMVISSAGAWLLAHSHAASVADIAALAAATQGSCTAAHQAARVNGSELENCVWQGSDVIVVVSSQVGDTPIALPVTRIEASARAGF